MPDVRVLVTADVPADLLRAVRQLLDEAFAAADPDEAFDDDDWDHTVGGQHVLVTEGGVLVAHASVVPRDLHVADRPLRTGYVEGVATAVSHQGHGLGSLATERATQLVRSGYEMGGLGTGLHDFYARWGWERWRGPTYARHGTDVVRTEDDDDGVMVLRFGPSADVDLTAPISCDERSGDDW